MHCPACGVTVQTFRNPTPTVDIIIETEGGVVLIERKNPPHGWALPGGFVDYGECYEDAARREAEEETGLREGDALDRGTLRVGFAGSHDSGQPFESAVGIDLGIRARARHSVGDGSAQRGGGSFAHTRLGAAPVRAVVHDAVA